MQRIATIALFPDLKRISWSRDIFLCCW